ncbi:hypothetical protein NEFER03_1645 [Nematocida sp. LUAm3]|nr:hypothetical protein NEFER03_1645 [Nematocida sp. LUAm3]KAI5174669.1 hypothetical protein NEFER02_0779 [Nematocida sp. LUAm2]KAI5177921.1 hypothetical protein NEFER01_1123 [Nematocida sp. LUAm1]
MRIYSCVLLGAMALQVYAKHTSSADKVVRRVKKMNKKEPVALTQKMISAIVGKNDDVLEKLRLSVNSSIPRDRRMAQYSSKQSQKKAVSSQKSGSKIPPVPKRAPEVKFQKVVDKKHKQPLHMEKININNLKVEILALEEEEPKSDLVFSTKSTSENDKEIIVEIVEVRTEITGSEEKKEFEDTSSPCADVDDVKEGKVAKTESIAFAATELEESLCEAIKNIDSYVPSEEEKKYLEKLNEEIEERELGNNQILGKCVQILLVEVVSPETGEASINRLVFGLCVVKEENPLLGVYVNTFIFPLNE